MDEEKGKSTDIETNALENPQGHETDRPSVNGNQRPVEQSKDYRTSSNNFEQNKAENCFNFDFSEYYDSNDRDKSENANKNCGHALEEGLYDADIAEIYLGEAKGSMENGKYSGGSDSNLSEMTSSFGPVEDNNVDSIPRGDSQQSNHENCKTFSSGDDFKEDKDQLSNQSSNSIDSKKRPLSPSFVEDEEVETKRIKSEPLSYDNHKSEESKDIVIDLCPPVAVVAPLGHCEDILIEENSPVKTSKGDSECIKNDISSILDSLEQTDDKNTSLLDEVFEKMKSDIIEGHSFKTLDGNNWTFDGKSYSVHNASMKSNNEIDSNRNSFKTVKESSVKPEFKRTNSVENDIEDFEKVLNSVIAKANKIPKTNENYLDKKYGAMVQVCGTQKVGPNKQCQHPCNHVANSDLLRELLDQKTESNDKQTKARQEIDLSFLNSDLVSGKGLSVSSDKILQTRSIDPRLTSFPHTEKRSGMSQTKQYYDGTKVNNLPDATKLLEDDYMSLAEQCRASVTLHHKVPSQNLHKNQQVHSSSDNISANGASNIIKEAFDFATEISECSNDENESAMQQSGREGPTESRSHVFTNGSFNPSQRNENYSNRHNFDNALKIDLTQNHQSVKSPRAHDMHPGNGLLTFANSSGVQSPETNLPPQLAGPFMNSADNAVTAPQDTLKQFHFNQRSMMHSKNVEPISAYQNRMVAGSSEMQQFSTQNPNISNGNPMKHLAVNQMDSLQNPGLAHRQNRYMSHTAAGYRLDNTAYPGHMSRNGMPDFRPGPEERALNLRYNSGHSMGHVARPFLPSENMSMGMQERIRAMNVQQWYRRRMQAQMNRPVHPNAQQMVRHPVMQGQGMGAHPMLQGQGIGSHAMAQSQGLHQMAHAQGTGPYPTTQGMSLQANTMGTEHRLKLGQAIQEHGSVSNSGLQGQDIDPRLRTVSPHLEHMSNSNAPGNHRMHQNTFPYSQNDIKPENQGQVHMQYRQRMGQQSRIPNVEVPNSMQMSKSFPTDMFMESTNSHSAQQVDHTQHHTFTSGPTPTQDLFPFDV